MKTLLLIVGIVLLCTITSVGQNYIGMSQSKILKSVGQPDKVGENYIVYHNLNEVGDNIYYFDENGNCNSYEICRNNTYLNEYRRVLNREFNKSCQDHYFKKIKKINYQAELSLSQDTFTIKIHLADDLTACNCNQLASKTHLISFE